MDYAPVVLFAYNRPEHIKATIDALEKNTIVSHSELFIFCDGPKTDTDRPAVESVRNLCRKVKRFASVHLTERDNNIGLANSVIIGVTEILERFPGVIVVEDDLITSSFFLEYMNYALTNYRNDQHVFSIGGHSFPSKILSIPKKYRMDTYASYRCCSWGWATWPDRWKRVDWTMSYFNTFMADKAAQELFNRGGSDLTKLLQLQYEHKISSWAIRFDYAHFVNDMYCIRPVKSLVENIGLDNSGTHSSTNRAWQHFSLDSVWKPKRYCLGGNINEEIVKNFYMVFQPRPELNIKRPISLARKIVRKGRSLLRRMEHRILHPQQNIDVLLVNTFEQYGGAAKAAHRTFTGIRTRFTGARYLTLLKDSTDPCVIGFQSSSFKGSIARMLLPLDQLILKKYGKRQSNFFSPAFWPNPIRIPMSNFKAKLVHLHWVAYGMLRVEELMRLQCPIIWTLHDAWAFTGGCHYTGNCENYKNKCGHCPILKSNSKRDLSYSLMRRKGKVFSRLDLTVVTPSTWLANIARQSSLLMEKRIEVIPNGLDTNIFKPIARKIAREYLGLPKDKPVLLFGAHSLMDNRKGSDLLRQTLSMLNIPCVVITFGGGDVILDGFPDVIYRSFGLLSDEISLALIYSAADVFICPSREDNLPNTVAEALACGTPCAAFNIGGLPDMIDHGQNGWLAKPFEPEGLANGIRTILRHPRPQALREAARKKAVDEYSLERMTERYASLYSEILK